MKTGAKATDIVSTVVGAEGVRNIELGDLAAEAYRRHTVAILRLYPDLWAEYRQRKYGAGPPTPEVRRATYEWALAAVSARVMARYNRPE